MEPMNSVGTRRGPDAIKEQPMAGSPETQPAPSEPAPVDSLVEETLVEEVSIDGMCGVY